MAEPWLATMALDGRDDAFWADEGWRLGRGFSTTSPNGAKASRVRGTASITVPGFVKFIVARGGGIMGDSKTEKRDVSVRDGYVRRGEERGGFWVMWWRPASPPMRAGSWFSQISTTHLSNLMLFLHTASNKS
jgi:hypothetical protein